MSKAIGRIYGVGTRSPYGYETDYMKYLQGYNPYDYEQTLRNMSQSYADISAKPEYNYIPPAMHTQSGEQQLKMPAGSEYYITKPKPQEPSSWDKIKDWAENTGDAMQAGAVGYATGATLGNFDEGMGAATSAVTGNPDNYTMVRDATRQLQNELQQRYPYIYGGAEFVGAMTTPMHLVKEENFKQKAFNALTDTLNASAGYAQSKNDFLTNLAVNGIANIAGLGLERLPIGRAFNSNTGKKLITNGYKFARQGLNSVADKLKNMYYNDEDEERYHY